MKYIALIWCMDDRYFVKSCGDETLSQFRKRISECYSDKYQYEICEYKPI